jgi:hypothetical protein
MNARLASLKVHLASLPEKQLVLRKSLNINSSNLQSL